jgi:centrosomal protein CEP104
VLKQFAMFKQPDVDYQVSRAVELAVKNFESQNAEVRTAANDLIFECFKKVGFDRIEPMLAGVRVNLVEALFRRFNEYLGKDADDNVLTNLRERYQASAKGKPSKVKNEGVVGAKTCDFCSRNDRNFMYSQKYDMHLYRECPMLTNCRGCGMVIEISKLTTHLSEECTSQAKAYTLCEECGLHYQRGEYEDHKKKGQHVQPEEDEAGPHQFCPLCHVDIGSGNIAWRRHLIYDGCRNNDRTM